MILVGKLASTYVIGVVQILILWGVTTALGANWGGEIVAVALMVLAVVLAGSGLGTLICGIASRPQHVDVYGTALLMLMGIASGTFTSPDFLGEFNWISKLTPNYWGIKGFNALTEGSSLADVAPNLAVLALMGIVLFLVGVWRFNRHLDMQ
jgi:ABC-2 type transport system permease protein